MPTEARNYMIQPILSGQFDCGEAFVLPMLADSAAMADSGKPPMRAARVHGNFAEYVPFALLLLVMVELRGAPGSQALGWTLHTLGLVLVLGRASHAFGVSRTPENFRWRVTGMMLTFAVFLLAAVAIVLT